MTEELCPVCQQPLYLLLGQDDYPFYYVCEVKTCGGLFSKDAPAAPALRPLTKNKEKKPKYVFGN